MQNSITISQIDQGDTMRYLLIGLLISLTLLEARNTKVDVSQIYGRIQYVDAFPDFKVEVVEAFEDLRVKEVNAFPDRAGRWQIVTAFPDFKIQKVKAFGDFKIRYVDAFEGVNK
jgi:hypothetical protein